MDHFVLSLLAFGSLLLISVFASKTSARYGIPVLLVFIAIGMLSGSDGPGGIYFNDAGFTQKLGTIALIFILFSGGLSTKIEFIKPIWKEGVVLASAGVVLSTIIMAGLVHLVMGWSLLASALLGATVSSTDAAAVFGILRTKKLNLDPKMQALLELESGSNDPMAVFLTLTLIYMIEAPGPVLFSHLFLKFFIQMAFGGLAGWFLGKGVVKMINWLNLEFNGLYPVLTIGGVITIYAITEYCGGNGFLSVYLSGMAIGNEAHFNRKSLSVFHDGLAWLMQVAMFLALGLLVYPSEIPSVLVPGTLLALGLMLIARPLSTWLCLIFFKYRWKEVWFVSWGGLRGAVPIILATYFLVEDVPMSKTMFNIIFIVVIISMLVQGTSIGVMAHWMDVRAFLPMLKRLPFISSHRYSDFLEYEIKEASELVGRSIFQLHLPKSVLVVLIHRGHEEFIPRGNSTFEAFDRVICLANKKVIPDLEKVFKEQKGQSAASSGLSH